jgi:hypothetical protein
MSAIRVLIHDMPPLLHSLVAAMLQSEEGIILLDPETLDLEHSDGGPPADVVLMSASDPLFSGYFLSDSNILPPRGIVAIADDAAEATIIQLNDSIGAAIRIAAARRTPN